MDSVLILDGIVKAFPGVKAVDNMSLEIQGGEIHALLGHNGAGKSTLVKIISGAYQRDEGKMLLLGRSVDFGSPRMAIDAGIHMVYQELDLIPYLSGAENIYLGQARFHNKLGLIDYRRKLRAAQELIKPFDVDIDLAHPVGELSVPKQQIIAIAKAISSKANVIILDEPTSALNDSETAKLFEILRLLTADGVAIILITHRLNEVFQIADRVTVMRDGKLIFTKRIGDVRQDEIIRSMADISISDHSKVREVTQHTESVLECRSIGHRNTFRDISFTIRKGEVLGLTGLIGCGAIEIARAIYGAGPRDSGYVEISGATVKSGDTEDAARKGIAFLSDDRKRDGLVLVNTVRMNTTITVLHTLSRLGFVNQRLEASQVQRMVERLQIRTSGESQLAMTLSGGNQQKVVLAKWLLKHSKAMLLCEPTRGIDVATKREFHQMIRNLAAEGLAVLVVSSEIDEILDTCDRMLVLYEGRVFGELQAHELDKTKIINWMYGIRQ